MISVVLAPCYRASDSNMKLRFVSRIALFHWCSVRRTSLNLNARISDITGFSTVVRVYIISGTERNGGTDCDWPVDGIGHR